MEPEFGVRLLLKSYRIKANGTREPEGGTGSRIPHV